MSSKSWEPIKKKQKEKKKLGFECCQGNRGFNGFHANKIQQGNFQEIQGEGRQSAQTLKTDNVQMINVTKPWNQRETRSNWPQV